VTLDGRGGEWNHRCLPLVDTISKQYQDGFEERIQEGGARWE
jgi:hypothetical protein